MDPGQLPSQDKGRVNRDGRASLEMAITQAGTSDVQREPMAYVLTVWCEHPSKGRNLDAQGA